MLGETPLLPLAPMAVKEGKDGEEDFEAEKLILGIELEVSNTVDVAKIVGDPEPENKGQGV